MKFRLFHYWRSSSSWRVRWALALKKIPCEYVAVNLLSDEPDSPEYLKRNPMGYVPSLELIQGEAGMAESVASSATRSVTTGQPKFLCESMAILEYFEETFPNPALLPRDPFDRAKVRQLAETINAGTQPLQNLNVLQFYSSEPEQQRKWARQWIQKGLGAYEELITSTAGLCSYGDQITLADLVLIPQCYNALRNEVNLSEFPAIEKIYRYALTTEACKASAPDAFSPPDKK